jgi:hypothetical protein
MKVIRYSYRTARAENIFLSASRELFKEFEERLCRECHVSKDNHVTFEINAENMQEWFDFPAQHSLISPIIFVQFSDMKVYFGDKIKRVIW